MRRLEKKMVLKATIYDGTGNPWKYLDSQGAKDMEPALSWQLTMEPFGTL
jgi:hypothetical protein